MKLDLHPDLIQAATRRYIHGPEAESEILPNKARRVPRTLGRCAHGPGCSHEHLTAEDCPECVNTGLAGPYPPEYAEQCAALGGHPVEIQEDAVDDTSGTLTMWVIACHRCAADRYPGGFPGIRVAGADRWLVPPGSGR